MRRRRKRIAGSGAAEVAAVGDIALASGLLHTNAACSSTSSSSRRSAKGSSSSTQTSTPLAPNTSSRDSSSLLENLDNQQRSVVTCGWGPTLVIAGPGSGKTRVLTHRIAWLMLEGGREGGGEIGEGQKVKGQEILAVTFTNKAAREMQERVGKLLGAGGRDGGMPMVGTFHSVCLRVLRQFASSYLEGRYGLSAGFTVYDEEDALRLMKEVLPRVLREEEEDEDRREIGPRIKRRIPKPRTRSKGGGGKGGGKEGEEEEAAAALLSLEEGTDGGKGEEEEEVKGEVLLKAISSAKNAGWSPNDVRRGHLEGEEEGEDESSHPSLPHSLPPSLLARAYETYQAALQARNSVDFDDLLLLTRELLMEEGREGGKILREVLQRRWRHVLVDEWQDTNRVQYDIIRLLCTRPPSPPPLSSSSPSSLMVVGDLNQAIYGFRGADGERALSSFHLDFPHSLPRRLETNYRSTHHIINAAEAVIQGEGGREDEVAGGERVGGMRGVRSSPHLLTVVEAHDEEGEAGYIAQEAKRLLKGGREGGVESLAILYRTNAQARALEEGCRRVGLPYRVVGSQSFFTRKEVKDALAFLRLLANPFDVTSLQRIINVPPRKIGTSTADAFMAFAAAEAQEGKGAEEGERTGMSAVGCLLSFLPEEELKELVEKLRSLSQPLRVLREGEREGRMKKLKQRVMKGKEDVEEEDRGGEDDPLVSGGLLDIERLLATQARGRKGGWARGRIGVLQSFARLVGVLLIQSCGMSVPALLHQVVEGEGEGGVGLRAFYNKPSRRDPRMEERVKNLEEMVVGAATWEEREGGREGGVGVAMGGALVEFLEDVALMADEMGGEGGGMEGRREGLRVPFYQGRGGGREWEGGGGSGWRDGIPASFLRDIPNRVCVYVQQAYGGIGSFEAVPDTDTSPTSSFPPSSTGIGGGGGLPSASSLLPPLAASASSSVGGTAVGPDGVRARKRGQSSLLPMAAAGQGLEEWGEEEGEGRMMRVLLEGGGKRAMARTRARAQALAREREAARLRKQLQASLLEGRAAAEEKTDVWTLNTRKEGGGEEGWEGGKEGGSEGGGGVLPSSSRAGEDAGTEAARRAREGTILEIKERLRQLEEEGSALLATSKEAYAAAASAAAARGAGGVGAARVVMVSAPLSAPGGGGSSSSVGGTGRSGSSSGSGDRDTMASPAGAGGGAGGAAVTGRPRGRPRKSAVGGEEGREGAGGGGTPRIFTLPKGIVVGKRVRHPTWGVGKVVEVEEEERSVEVDFVIGPVRLVGELEVGKLVKA
ncbi:atp-dependent dna helicase [Nannochloropsis oceanica]